MQAGLLRDWRTRLSESNRIRSETAAYFSQRLSLAPAAWTLASVPAAADSRRDADRTGRIHALSQQRGLGMSLAYPTPINEIPEISAAFDGQRFPVRASASPTTS